METNQMNMEVVKYEEFGLDEQKAKEITKDLPQIIKERDVLVSQYNEILKLDIDDPETAKMASELRRLIKNNRTKGFEDWRRVNKEYFLRGGQFVDAKAKLEIAENKRMEEALEQVEKRQEIIEAKRIEKLNQERIELISPYLEDVTGLDLGSMQNDVFEAYLTAKKNAHEAKIEAERKAEEERLEAERKEKLYNDRKEQLINYWNFWNKEVNLAEISDKEFNKILSDAKKAHQKHEAEQEAIRKENERLKKEREAEQARLKAKQEKREAEEKKRREKEDAERKAKEAEIAEYKAKLDAEKKREQLRMQKEKEAEDARLKAEQEAKKAPDKEKIRKAIDYISMPELELDDNAKEVYDEVCNKFNSFKLWANNQINNI